MLTALASGHHSSSDAWGFCGGRGGGGGAAFHTRWQSGLAMVRREEYGHPRKKLSCWCHSASNQCEGGWPGDIRLHSGLPFHGYCHADIIRGSYPRPLPGYTIPPHPRGGGGVDTRNG